MTNARPDTPATRAIGVLDIAHTVTQHGRVDSLEEAAAARGVSPDRLLKTLVIRRGDDDYVLVLVPGDRQISWPKLRAHLGVNRLSLPDQDVAERATGYERGTITPFGARPSSTGAPWPVVADALVAERAGTVSIGGGAHGVGISLDAGVLVEVLRADVADVTEPA